MLSSSHPFNPPGSAAFGASSGLGVSLSLSPDRRVEYESQFV